MSGSSQSVSTRLDERRTEAGPVSAEHVGGEGGGPAIVGESWRREQSEEEHQRHAWHRTDDPFEPRRHSTLIVTRAGHNDLPRGWLGALKRR